MVFVIEGRVETVPENKPVREMCDRFHQIAKEIANSVVPVQLSSNGNLLARVLATEVLRNTLHGSETTIKIERLDNGDFELTTLNHHGPDRLVSQYSPLVEAEIPHQGNVLIERIAGSGNHSYQDDGTTVITRTHLDRQAILAVSKGGTKCAAHAS